MNAPRERVPYRDVHGILLLDKPQGLSSNQALQKARHLFRAKKAGHTGSLDPLATGLLPICFGEATKVAGYLLGSRKAYAAECRLGITTTTDDSEGEVVQTRTVHALDAAAIEAALKNLRGRITQVPPIYSALKQGGVALYKRARRGEEVTASPRAVEVFRFDLIEHAGDTLRLHVECGSGTYVRSLVRDLGAALGCGAHLTALRRLWVEPFHQPAMHTLAQLDVAARETQGAAMLDTLLLPLETALAGLPGIMLTDEQALCLRRGQRLCVANTPMSMLSRALDLQGKLVALVEVASDGTIRVRRGFN